MEMTEREKFFYNRAGYKVFSPRLGKPGPACEKIYNEGRLIRNREHGAFLHDLEKELQKDGGRFQFFTTKEERDEFEATLPVGNPCSDTPL